MLRVVIMNTKGGCGKTTVATNLASYCASQGYGTALFDYDKQASSSRWIKLRPLGRPIVHGVKAYEPPQLGVTRAWQLRVPDSTRYIIMDTPAGHSDADLDDRVAGADIILIPVLPSVIDILSTADFIRDLLLIGKARARNRQLAIVANRTRIRTKAVEKLERFLQSLDIPVIARIRDTQHYVNAVEMGIGAHERPGRDAKQDEVPWAQILTWLEHRQQAYPESELPPPSLAMPAGN